MTGLILRGLLLALVVLVCMPNAGAQTPQDPGIRDVTRTFAITNARVVQSPGNELPRATVIIRDGVITAVAANAPVPFDAEIIEGDTLVVYAGFIDALGETGVDTPSVPTDRVADPDDPPRERSGVLPDRLARHHLDPDDSAIEQMRAIGFTAANVAPSTGMLSGQSSLILLAGDRPEELIFAPDVALVARFQGGSGVYPSTPMAVAATLQQVYRQADQAGMVATQYAADPTGRRRPAFDPVADALRPSLEGRQPVFFITESPLEGHRALRLARELDLNVVIAGLPESSMLVERLREQNVSVLAPLALPDVVERDTTLFPTDPQERLADHLAGEIFITEHRTRSYLDLDDEQRVLQERRLIAAGLYERNALTLQEAGVPFAFASLGESPGTFRANLRRMIAAGLSAEAALAGLTTGPARILGVDRVMGTVEAGRLANLVITNGDYFDEDTRVRYVFVDGRRFEIDDTPVAEADPDAEVTVIGRWDFSVVTPEGPISGTMTFTGTPDAPAATLDVPQLGSMTATDIRIEGNQLSFSVPDAPPGPLQISGVIVGDTYEAQVTAPGAPTLSLTATRRPN